MNIAFYRTRNTFELLPSITYSYMDGSDCCDHVIMFAFLYYTFEISWTTYE
jgi:hypothetical protein